MNLIDYIEPDTEITKSVNLERDMGDIQTLSCYIVTEKGLLIIKQFVEAIKGKQNTSWALIGPYGMGKSAFVNFLVSMTGPNSDPDTNYSHELFKQKDSALFAEYATEIKKQNISRDGFLRIAVTSSYEPVNCTLIRGLYQALIKHSQNEQKKELLSDLIEETLSLKNLDYPPTNSVLQLFLKALEITQSPVLIVIDELGKNLEYMSHNVHQGDLYILQLLAETKSVFLWVCLHQAFEEYYAGLSEKQLREWGKIQGRFTDISFIESKRQMLTFLLKGLNRTSENNVLNTIVEKWSETFYIDIQALKLPILNKWDVKKISKLFPVHPLVAFLLPELCTAFAQNDRTLFSFLCSNEPNALPQFLNDTVIDSDERLDCSFTVDKLYDYFFTTATTVFLNKSTTQRWIEIDDIISKAHYLDYEKLKLLKTIGLLNLISNKSGIPASEKIIHFALKNPFESFGEQKKIKSLMTELLDEKTLIYRSYADEYRLWEGSDFDVQKAIREKKAELHTKQIDDILNETIPLEHLIASKHSYETGTLRRFELRWISTTRFLAEQPDCISDDFDGLILYCFGKNRDFTNPYQETSSHKPLIVAYCSNESQILDMLLDAAAANDILQKAPELTRDAVARKEARYIANAAMASLNKYLGQSFNPLSQTVIWQARDEIVSVLSHRDLSTLISRECDLFYGKCPIINNEMINYNKISSAASQARRELINAMLLNSYKENLGLEGTGPSVALYRSILKKFALHQKNIELDVWQLFPPEEGNSFYPVWLSIEREITRADKVHLPVSTLFQILKKPPLGLKDGPIPIIISLYLIINSDEVAIYQEGVYIPFIDTAEIELLVKRPDLFSVRYFNPVGIRKQIFQIYKSLLNSQAVPHAMHIRNATMVNVVGPLIQFANNLPKYTKQTKSISAYAINVRTALIKSNEPIELLFDELPKALQMKPFDECKEPDNERINDFQHRLSETIVELAETYSNLVTKLGMIIQKAFNSNQDISTLKVVIPKRLNPIRNQCTEKELNAVIKAICRQTTTDEEWIESVAGCVIKKTVTSWNDSDLEGFPAVINNIARRLNELEALISQSNNDPVLQNTKLNRSVVSVILPNGKYYHETIEIDSKTEAKLKQKLNGLNLDTRECKILMAMIANTIMDNNIN